MGPARTELAAARHLIYEPDGALISLPVATLVTEDGRAMFHEPQFVSAFEFYVDMFRRGFAPVVPSSLIANLFQQFAEGEFAMFISGPWQVGELRRRLSAEFQSRWATAPTWSWCMCVSTTSSMPSGSRPSPTS